MYKVFICNKPVIFSVNVPENEQYSVVHWDKNQPGIKLVEVIQKEAEKGAVVGLAVIAEHPDSAWSSFKAAFRYVEAAGGLVRNQQGALLFIYRLGRWDLPKGKLEKGETVRAAGLREVEEECGIGGLEITGELPSTYHTYSQRGKEYFKCTYWFEMKTDSSAALIPQEEEGIEAVEWLHETELPKVFENTYETIKELLNAAGLVVPHL